VEGAALRHSWVNVEKEEEVVAVEEVEEEDEKDQLSELYKLPFWSL
jgi:hypothetical protein